MTHVSIDAINYGPPRGYWCYGFEGFNRQIKRGVNRSNFRDPELSCLYEVVAHAARVAEG